MQLANNGVNLREQFYQDYNDICQFTPTKPGQTWKSFVELREIGINIFCVCCF